MMPTDPEARYRQALGKVYALLLSLAEEEDTANTPSGKVYVLTVVGPTPEGADREEL